MARNNEILSPEDEAEQYETTVQNQEQNPDQNENQNENQNYRYGDSLFSDPENTNLITQLIRDEITYKQELFIQEQLYSSDQINQEDKEKHLQDLAATRAFLQTGDGEKILEKLKKNQEFQKIINDIESKGHKKIESQFKDEFTTIDWKQNSNGSRSKEVKSESGKILCTLNEKTIKTPLTVNVRNSEKQIKSYRQIEFPKEFAGDGEALHLKMKATDQNGNRAPDDIDIYFTAHYNDAGKLTDVTLPTLAKFTGKDENAIPYVEKDGKIYTLPITRRSYEEMLKEVEKNNSKDKNNDKVIDQTSTTVDSTKPTVNTPANDKPLITDPKKNESGTDKAANNFIAKPQIADPKSKPEEKDPQKSVKDFSKTVDAPQLNPMDLGLDHSIKREVSTDELDQLLKELENPEKEIDIPAKDDKKKGQKNVPAQPSESSLEPLEAIIQELPNDFSIPRTTQEELKLPGSRLDHSIKREVPTGELDKAIEDSVNLTKEIAKQQDAVERYTEKDNNQKNNAKKQDKADKNLSPKELDKFFDNLDTPRYPRTVKPAKGSKQKSTHTPEQYSRPKLLSKEIYKKYEKEVYEKYESVRKNLTEDTTTQQQNLTSSNTTRAPTLQQQNKNNSAGRG